MLRGTKIGFSESHFSSLFNIYLFIYYPVIPLASPPPPPPLSKLVFAMPSRISYFPDETGISWVRDRVSIQIGLGLWKV